MRKMIFPLILTLAAICQVAPASSVEDFPAKERDTKAIIHRFMGCMQENLENIKRLVDLKQNPNFSHASAPSFNTIYRDSVVKPVERRVETKRSDNLHAFRKRHGYIQQKFSEKTQTTRNYLNINHEAIYVNDTEVSWNEARNRCIDKKAQLAIIDSAEMETFMINFLKKHNITRAWIGVHSLFGGNQWTTIKGDRLESLPYVHWAEYQPDNYGGNERCVVLNQRGMDDLACDTKAECICQWLE